MAKTNIMLYNLNCTHCAGKIEEAVNKLDFVNKAEFNFITKKMTIDSDKSAQELLPIVKSIVDSIEDGVDTQLEKSACKTTNIMLYNLNCTHCAGKIEEAVRALDFVDDVEFNFITKKMTINSDKSAQELLPIVKSIVDSIEDGVDTQLEKSAGKATNIMLYNLNCTHCAGKIEEAVRALDFVDDVEFNFVTKKMTINSDKSAQELLPIVKSIVDSIEDGVDTQLEKTEASAGNTPAAQHNDDNIIKKGIIRIILGGIFLSGAVYFDYKILYVIPYIIFGYDVVIRAVKNILKGDLFDENFLMSLATIAAFIIGENLEAVTVMLFYQIGEFLQDLAVDRSRRSIMEAMQLKPENINIIKDDIIIEAEPESVAVGDIMLVRSGEKVAVDGTITDGSTSFDMMALTGESLPVEKKTGDKVLSGSINCGEVVKIRADKSYSNSTIARIMDMVENAAGKKSVAENMVTKFAKVYTPIVVIIGILLAIVPGFIFGNFTEWISRALVFLVASCPCALVVSIPLTFFSGLGTASTKGILIKGSNYLQMLGDIDTVAMDKTGTITKGEFSITERTGENDGLKLAASLERFSTHPIALAIVKSYSGEYVTFDRQEEISGYGIIGYMNNDKIAVGGNALMNKEGIEVKDNSYDIYTAVNNNIVAAFKIEDTIKPDSKQAITELKQLGVKRLVMLTGDKEAIAEKISKEAGITDYKAELLPQDKVTALESLYDKNSNHHIAAVGDGINDAPVLARADIGVAMGGIGSDAAIEAADVVIMNDELSKLAAAVKIAKHTLSIAKQNVALVIIIKIAVLVLAAVGHANMWLAIFADVGVALLAVLNSVKIILRAKK